MRDGLTTTVTLLVNVPSAAADAAGLAADKRSAGTVVKVRGTDAQELVAAGLARFGDGGNHGGTMGEHRITVDDVLTDPRLAGIGVPATDTAREKYIPARLSDVSLRAAYVPRQLTPAIGDKFKNITIVVYHDIALATFQADCDLYQAWNYTTVTCDQVYAYLNGTGTLPAKPLLLTFDDGYVSQYNAAQELNARGMVGVFYIATGWIDGTITGASFGASGTVATWTQIQQMHTWGMDIQAHTVHHIDMQTLTAGQVTQEFTDCKARLEAQVPGITVRHLAYPYGSWNTAVRNGLAAAGCLTARVVRIAPDNTYPGANAGRWAFATALNDSLALPSAGAGAAAIAQANYHHTVARDEELVPDYGFVGGGKGWAFAAGATVDTTDFPAGFTRSLSMPQQASSVQSQPSSPIYVGNWAALEISVWIKTIGMGTVFGRLNLVLQKSDGTTTYSSLSPVPGIQQTGTNGWTQYTGTYYGDHNVVFVLPQLYVQTSGTPTGTTKFAGLSIRKAGMASVIPVA